ncbi:MAG TPA: ShlB/FhaC/HecB family hemolysin secretion/activation protein [Candidatus Rifleibacterium sp.]|nr:ShlB/FhaC/HecB family hemolysin secretion/activation protein [Candidatus Rifleibacterium sp.]
MLKFERQFLISLFVCASMSCVYAQPAAPILEPANTSGAYLNRILDNFQKTRLERQLKREIENPEKTEKPTTASAAEPKMPEIRVTLKAVEFSRSSVLTPEQLKEMAAGYVNRELGIAELKEFIGGINNWYRSHGYITAIAALPPQEIKDGKLKVLLIEGLIGNVRLAGNANTRSGYIRSRLGIPQNELLDIRNLDRDLIQFNGTNDIKARIKLQAGEKPGTTDCYILVYEPQDKTGSLFIDTAGSKGTGETRVGLTVADASISGNRDSLTVTSLMSNTSKAAMLGYNFPINRRGTRISFYHSFNNLLIDNAGLEIRGASRSTGFSVTHPMRVGTSFKSELIFDAHRQNSENRVFGLTFVDDSENRFSIGSSFLRLSSGAALYWRPTVVFCDYKGLGDDQKLRKYQLDAMWQKVLPGKRQLQCRLIGQKACDEFIPSADQFFLGGMYSVRGYEESVIGGDSGINLKLDYLFPIGGFKTTKMFVFYDWGRIYGKSFANDRMIHALGFGFSHSFAGDSQVVFSVGYPLVKELNVQAVDGQKLELSMNVSF